jgi:predicted DNA-binding transcriptional regulator YafY
MRVGLVMGAKNIYERFIWFDYRARTKKYPNATSLAENFEISTKTAQRDIEFMRGRLNCPLKYDVRKKGYYYENETFSLPMVYLSSDELSSLLIAKKMLQDIGRGKLGDEISSIIRKITNLVSKHTAFGESVDERFSFQLIGYSPVPEGTFKIVLEGCLRRRRLTFTYQSPARHEKDFRTVDPYHLLNYMGTWHLIGYCHMRGMIRDFVLGRILDVELLDETFEKPEDFDIKGYFGSSFGIYKGGPKTEVTLRFTPEKSKWIKEQIWHKEQKSRFLRDGSLELSFPVEDFSEIKMEVLKHGDQVKVVSPKRLRDLIKDEAERIAKIY